MCTLLPENDYQYLLDNKIDKIKSLFGDFSLPELSIYPSQKKHYRMRAEFRIWHEEDEIYHIMFDSKTKKRKRVDVFPTASELINEAMKAIIPLLKYNETLRYQLFQIDYLSTLSGELLISLLYHKKLSDEWVIEAKQLKKSLNELGLNANLIGRASSQKICLDQDYVDEKLDVLNQTLIYRQVENSFTQPNAKININMLTWAIQSTKESLGDLLELYCGNGNFSIALAQNFEHVIATEIAKTSVKSAQHNIKVNRTDNVKIVRLSAEEFTQVMNNERTFNRLNGICLSDYQFNTVLVDPPRSGLDDKTLLMISKYKTIIYISCNPLTLRENLTILSQTHEIKYMAAFDQFPYTDHLELGMILKRK